MIKKGVIMGKADESLKRIVKLGNDLGFSPGTCGKDGQWVPVSDAQPTTLFEELLVGTPE
jgi:TldD protein